jgi:glycosyltransferase involved in cell wall biosynthesis
MEEMKDILKDCSNYEFTTYSSSNSMIFHKDFDIAVVPTIYSEGTSLSLIEAMAAGCFPIATHVGGMTNILLDSYNGILTYPSEASLYNSLTKVLNMESHSFNIIVNNAYCSAAASFSLTKWKESWKSFLLSI